MAAGCHSPLHIYGCLWLLTNMSSSGLVRHESMPSALLRLSVFSCLQRKYSVSPHISDTHMSFSPPPANTSGGYNLSSFSHSICQDTQQSFSWCRPWSPHPQYENDPSQASFPLTASKSFSIFLQSKSGSPNRLPNTPTCAKQASTILREFLIYLIKICICVHTMFPLLNHSKYSLKSEQYSISLCIFALSNN